MQFESSIERSRSHRVQRSHRGRSHVRDEVDLVILELVRLAYEPHWSPEHAAEALRAREHSRGALRLALSRVIGAQLDRPSPVAERAAATVRAALAA